MQNGTHEQHDAIVIGGGLAGLAAATYLARASRDVTVLERTGQLGGRAITNDLGGYLFNLGPHAVYRKGAGANVLRELGVDYHGRVPPTSGYAIRNGALRFLSQNPVSFVTSRSLSAGAKLALTRFQVRIATVSPAKVRHLTVPQWLEREVPNADARAIASALVRVSTYSSDPELSAEVAVMQLKLALRGVLYLDGGWQTLVDGLRAAAERAGVRIETGAPVERIEHNGAVRAVRLKDGRSLPANAVLIAGGPDMVAALTESAVARAWASSAVPVRAACLDVGLRRLPKPERGFAFGTDEPLYISVHTRVARLAPEGCETVHAAKYLAPGDTDAKRHEAELEGLVDLVQPGWRDELAQRRYLPNMVVINAAVHASREGIAGRPGPDVPGIERLYVAGDWVGPEGWLSDASLASAKRAAELLLSRPTVAVARDSVAAAVA